MKQRLHRRQVVGGSIGELFAFFKDPKNLEIITPTWLGFSVTEAPDQVDRVGVRIAYRLRLHGIPLCWMSRISEYVEGELFADEMLTGPYRSWYHRHHFRAVPSGVEIEDVVDYSLPFGVLGRLAHGMFVRRQLEAIFDYRAQEIARRFPLSASAPADHIVTS